ncbi:MAG: hypothetical protein QFX33_00085 [Candidatus Nezhaarchaeota archaeon]|nr:hypothetical protein [Candidatus Nezhaarchaeota archaeon]
MSREKTALIFTLIGFIVILLNYVPEFFTAYALGMPITFWGTFFTGIIIMPVLTALWIYVDERPSRVKEKG